MRTRTVCSFLVALSAAQAITGAVPADDNDKHTISCVIDSTAGQGGADGENNQKIGRIFTSIHKAPLMSPAVGAWVFFGVEPHSAVNACNYFGLQFRFDSGTPDGKALLSTLLYAKAAGKNVDINYCSPQQLGLQAGGNCKDLTQVTIAGAISARD